mmetsp:Transcript_17058/g.28484  ORF Transcript_17058/g.28484 Transcript_17058/m.28484 type:complete len:289 (+) Transcript_17058:29-895(+)|eukprot:CAMPEP_0114429128 /NCGR_PEP_ID=MMETSP0103-20121206/9310_1 /TAXON_ID=37642 ORGANISM="Paraphysomonas imperforata, Strain PA2" /NCGR_SAMPLE_ID=MMETSP0103 /ASSEMBLY_ACC=CAM_ASM_000201 /LENGTH=288 /DNA_ID=CAMNT_0001598423 /DNA_START=32 /DNA_END=898 /DNA_ORIENTATION=-
MASFIKASEKKWSATAALYIRYFEQYTVAMGATLLTNLKLRFHDKEALRVIECGSGAGALAVEISRQLLLDSPSAASPHQLTIVDLSESMMDIAKSRLGGSALQPTTVTADATALPFPDASFDRYICNMTVHYAPNADAFLQEASRVLAPGGLAGFTVWGREEFSPAFTTLPSVKKKLGLVKEPAPDAAPSRSNFHMGEDDDALRQRVLAAGFSSCVIWHSPSVLEATSAEGYADTMIEGANSTKQEVLGWSEDMQATFRAEVVDAAAARLERGEPMALDVCYCVAQK